MVAFATGSDLASGATPRTLSVYLRDRPAGRTTLVSVARIGGPADAPSQDAEISADGGTVAFSSYASNLVRGATVANQSDVYVRDVAAGRTERVSGRPDGSEAHGASRNPSLSANGRWVAFNSSAAGLTADDRSADSDVFVRDRVTGVTTLASVDLPGARVIGDAPALSSDGRWVVFEAYLSGPGLPRNTKRVLLRDLATRRTVQVTKVETSAGEGPVHPVVSRDGRFVAFGTVVPLAGGSGGVEQVLRWSRATGKYQLVSAAPGGAAGNGYSLDPSISDDGRYVSFTSYALNLTGARPTSRQVYLRDMVAGRTTMVSVTPSGKPGNRGPGPNSVGSGPADTSADGRHVAFTSSATNLLPHPDRNPYGADVFVRDALPGG